MTKFFFEPGDVAHFEIPATHVNITMPNVTDVTLSYKDKRINLTIDEIWTILVKLAREVGK